MIRVVVVEDSRTARRHLTRLFQEAGDFEVVGEASTRVEAEQLAEALKPDLVSLDVFLPDGAAPELVRSLMRARPVPIVLVSDTPRSAAEVFEALAAGALDLVSKPKVGADEQTAGFIAMMRIMSRVKVQAPRRRPARMGDARQIAAIGIASSTGGPGALRDLLAVLPKNLPVPVFVAQHLAPGFEPGLAQWLGLSTPLPVSVATQGSPVMPGTVVLGRSGEDLLTTSRGKVLLSPSGAGAYHPSADVLFGSLAEVHPNAALVIVLSGIGSDGANGAKAVVASGGVAFAQDKDSSAVYGMPQAATRTGIVSIIGSPAELGRSAAALVMRARKA